MMECQLCGVQVRGWIELKEHVREDHPEKLGRYI